MEPVVAGHSKKRSRGPAKALDIILLGLSVVGIIVLVNVLSDRHPYAWDVTSAKQFTLSDQSRLILKQLKTPVKVLAFMSDRDGSPGEHIKDILELYRRQSSFLEVDLIDIDKNPRQASAYGISEAHTVVFESGGNQKKVEAHNVYQYEDGKQVFRGEQYFTNAILCVLEAKRKSVYFTAGHQELSIEDGGQRGLAQIRSALQLENYDVKSIVLAKDGSIPQDAALLVVAGARKPYLPQEVDMMRGFIRTGRGRIIALLEPGVDSGLEGLLREVGVSVSNDIVIDLAQSLRTSPFILIPKYAPGHAITKDLAGSSEAFSTFNVTRSLKIEDEPKRRGHDIAVLMESSDHSWGETDLKNDKVTQDARERKGPLPLAVAVSRPGPDAELAPVMVICGDADCISNLSCSYPGNRDFFLNAVSWLMSDKMKMSIRPKPLVTKRTKLMTLEDVNTVFWTSVVVTPLLIVMAGGAVWWIRRDG